MADKRKLDSGLTVTREVIPHICKDAEKLGVTRYHLWAVLNGHRCSPTLVMRYKELKGREAV